MKKGLHDNECGHLSEGEIYQIILDFGSRTTIGKTIVGSYKHFNDTRELNTFWQSHPSLRVINLF